MPRAGCLLYLLLPCLLADAAAAQEVNEIRGLDGGRILNGQPVQPGSAPWAASLQTADGKHFCGASLVSPEPRPDGVRWGDTADPHWAITAAHCLFKADGTPLAVEDLRVASGFVDFGAPVAERAVQKVTLAVVHEGFRKTDATSPDDIALLRLAEPVPAAPLARRRSIVLPDPVRYASLYAAYAAVSVTGWGNTLEGGVASDRLQEVTVPAVANEECRYNYEQLGSEIGSGVFCAGFRSGGYDACQGDSGGGAFYHPVMRANGDQPDNRNLLVGVVSWGHGCGRLLYYGVYTRVSFYRNWLDSKVR